MLILTRRVDETIRIGNDITVTVLRVRGQEVRRLRRGDSEECRTAGADREEVAARKRLERDGVQQPPGAERPHGGERSPDGATASRTG